MWLTLADAGEKEVTIQFEYSLIVYLQVLRVYM